MNFAKYLNYWETKIGWLSEVPTDWKLKKAKYILRENTSIKNSPLQAGAICFGRVITKEDDSIPIETKNSYQEVHAGEFLINPINLNYDLKSLRTALSEINVCVSPAYIVATLVDDGCDKTFLKYLLHQFDVAHMKTLGAGVRQTITFKDIGDCYLPLPSVMEQLKIAKFLHSETTKIDELIHKQEKLIELLNEKIQSITSKLLVCGFNSDIELIDSDVDWIGKIPKHWNVKKFKFLATLIQEKTEEKTNVVALENIESWTGNLVETESKYEGDGISFQQGDVLFGKLRPYLAKVFFAQNSGQAFGDILVFRAINDINPSYLYRSILNNEFIKLVNSSTYGTKMPRANWDFIGNIKIAVPPLDEQIEIVNRIDSKVVIFEKLTIKAKQSIELLKEHRTSLISAAVTGKIDVRELV